MRQQKRKMVCKHPLYDPRQQAHLVERAWNSRLCKMFRVMTFALKAAKSSPMPMFHLAIPASVSRRGLRVATIGPLSCRHRVQATTEEDWTNTGWGSIRTHRSEKQGNNGSEMQRHLTGPTPRGVTIFRNFQRYKNAIFCLAPNLHVAKEYPCAGYSCARGSAVELACHGHDWRV